MTRIALLLFVLLALPAATALACSCLEPEPPQEAMKDAPAVFAGRVVSAVENGADSYNYKFRVYAVWKGPAPDHIDVATFGVDMCGLFMEVGAEYLVYTRGAVNQLTTDSCTRSKPVHLAETDLTALGSPITVSNVEPSMAMLKARYD